MIAKAIADLYYPVLAHNVSSLYGKSNLFWGYQENLLRTNINNDPEVWQSLFEKVFKVCKEIEQLSKLLLSSISTESAKISEQVNNKFE